MIIIKLYYFYKKILNFNKLSNLKIKLKDKRKFISFYFKGLKQHKWH